MNFDSFTFSKSSIDYLQRNDFDISSLEGFTKKSSMTFSPFNLRSLLRIESIARAERDDRYQTSSKEEVYKPPSLDFLSGLYGLHIPVAFQLSHIGKKTSINIGTWIPADHPRPSETMLDRMSKILQNTLQSVYSNVKFSKSEINNDSFTKGGLVLGQPAAKPPDIFDGSLQLDRILRALHDQDYSFLVLAQPIARSDIVRIRNDFLTEVRLVESSTQATQAPNTLEKNYISLVQVMLNRLVESQAIGAWRTAVYLLGNDISYHHLASVWQSIFAGKESLPEPIRVWESSNIVPGFVTDWVMPNESRRKGPGDLRYPFEYQTLLTTSQLATYVHLPKYETIGYQVVDVARFDVKPPDVKDNISISLGKVRNRLGSTDEDYRIKIDNLARHAFIAGTTGSGKTNTVFQLIKETWKLEKPFMVIEPAKKQYRTLLLNDDIKDLKDKLLVFTPGNENVSPFRLNPFQKTPGTPVGVHIDLLRSVFSASSGLWTPLPQILEVSLVEIYKDRGWDIAIDKNLRGENEPDSFPTLTDLYNKVDEVISRLGYEKKIEDNMRAALHTRINSLRLGAKGLMLDVQESYPYETLFRSPVVVELEHMGDDDDKAFLMGLLFIIMTELRREQDKSKELRHLLVIEEAHRLLANLGNRRASFEADPKGKAVETFASLMSEIRFYGQGLVAVDQIPTRLEPDIIKNSDLKIAHKIVSKDDREVLGASMVMNESQQKALATLEHEAVIFNDGNDAPLLVKADEDKDLKKDILPPDKDVRNEMNKTIKEKYLDIHEKLYGKSVKRFSPSSLDLAKRITNDKLFRRTFSRIVLSMIEDKTSLDRLWCDLVLILDSWRQPKVKRYLLYDCVFFLASKWLIERRGSQLQLSFRETRQLFELLHSVLMLKYENSNSPTKELGDQYQTKLDEFSQFAYGLHKREYDPYPYCSTICNLQAMGRNAPVCLYRYAVNDLINDKDYDKLWQDTVENVEKFKNVKIARFSHASMLAASQLVELFEVNKKPKVNGSNDKERDIRRERFRRTVLCHAQQMIFDGNTKLFDHRRNDMKKIIALVSEEGKS